MRSFALLVVVLLAAPLVPGAAPSAAALAEPAPYLVGFSKLPPGLVKGATYAGARVDLVIPPIGVARVLALDGEAFAARARADPRVVHVEADGIAHAMLLPNDPLASRQYAPTQVNLPYVWDAWRGSGDAAVCVVDTGVRTTHEDLAATYRGGYDFVNDDADPTDDHLHGTHVAGIAAAAIHNGKGIAGAADVDHYAVKVLGADGFGSWGWVASGIVWCADHTPPRTVISMSLGGDSESWSVREAARYAFVTKGKLLVASMGNSGDVRKSYPAATPYVMGIASTQEGETRSHFSTMGEHASLAAPGSNIVSALHARDNDYGFLSGTSMAAPLVSGIAALVWSRAPHLTNVQLREVLEQTAQDLGAPGHDVEYGWGEVDAAAALARVAIAPPANVTASRGDVPGAIRVSWSPPADGAPLAYRVYAGHSGPAATLVAETTATSFQEEALPDGQRRFYRVSSVAADGEGVTTAAVSATPATRPLAPRNATAMPDEDDATRATLSWKAPSDDGGLAIGAYVVYRDSGAGYEPHATVPGDVLAYEDKALVPGTKYRYQVAATNLAGEGPRSNLACLRAGAKELQPACAAPELVARALCAQPGSPECSTIEGDYGWGTIRPCREGSPFYVPTPVCALPSGRWIAEHA